MAQRRAASLLNDLNHSLIVLGYDQVYRGSLDPLACNELLRGKAWIIRIFHHFAATIHGSGAVGSSARLCVDSWLGLVLRVLQVNGDALLPLAVL